MTENTSDILTALKHIGVAGIGFLLIFLTGRYLPDFFLIIIPPAICAIGGWLASKGNKKAAIAWGVIGLIAGIGFWVAQ